MLSSKWERVQSFAYLPSPIKAMSHSLHFKDTVTHIPASAFTGPVMKERESERESALLGSQSSWEEKQTDRMFVGSCTF